jgi:hypothetical protein
MPNIDKKYRVFLSAAEPSADAHCAGLITAMQESRPGIEFVGVGGPKMAHAGCELLENTAGKAAMIYKAFSQVARFYKIIKRISRYLKGNNVDLVIVCDSPSFNFHVAKAAKKAGIKTLFFVAPQLWAWGGWRINNCLLSRIGLGKEVWMLFSWEIHSWIIWRLRERGTNNMQILSRKKPDSPSCQARERRKSTRSGGRCSR